MGIKVVFIPLHGHLGFFHTLVLKSNTAMNMGFEESLWDLDVNYFGYTLQSRFAESNIFRNKPHFVWVLGWCFSICFLPQVYSAILCPVLCLTLTLRFPWPLVPGWKGQPETLAWDWPDYSPHSLCCVSSSSCSLFRRLYTPKRQTFVHGSNFSLSFFSFLSLQAKQW